MLGSHEPWKIPVEECPRQRECHGVKALNWERAWCEPRVERRPMSLEQNEQVVGVGK